MNLTNEDESFPINKTPGERTPRRFRINPRLVIFWLFLIALIWILVSQFTEVKKLARAITQGQWQWIAAAAALQILYYLVISILYQSAFSLVGVKSRLSELIPVLFASMFVNAAVPTAGPSGSALFTDDAARRGESPTRATAGTLLTLIAEFAAFTVVLLIGMVMLFIYHDLKLYDIAGAVLSIGIALSLTGVLLIGLWRPEKLRSLVVWGQRTVGRFYSLFQQASPLADDWADLTINDFIYSAVSVREHPAQLIKTFFIGLLGQFIDLLSLYVIFRAFHHPITPGPLIAGFAVGILFWILSITPQGIGVVEGMMALVYTSLGVPAETAIAVVLVFRGLTFWLPLGIGFIVLQRVRIFQPATQSRARDWNVRIIAILTGIMGLVNVLSAVTPSLQKRIQLIEKFFPLEVRRGGHLTAALAGFALLLLANSLRRRKRTAWWITMILLVLSALSHLIKGLDIEEASLAALLAIWLGSLRPYFHARSDTPSIRQGFQILAAASGFTLLYGAVGFYFLDRHFSVNFGLWDALRQTITMFTQFYYSGPEPLTGFGRFFAGSIYLVGAATIGYAFIMLLRPVLVRKLSTDAEREHAEEIVTHYGRSSLARFTLFDDKAYYFSPGGSMIAYVAKGHTAAALGDVVGPESDLADAIAGFQQFCLSNDWQPAFYQTLPETLEAYKAAGFNAISIGQEAIVPLDTFTLKGNENKGLRSGFNRLAREGYQAQVFRPPLSDDLLYELRLISDEWLTAQHGTEKRFSLGWFVDEYVRSSLVMVVIDPEGNMIAFANLLPEYQLSEVSIDLMRHRQGMLSGTMDFLFASLFEWARSEGYQSFNLGLVSLSGVGEKPDDPAVERGLHYIFEHIDQFYNFKGLYAFKQKFHPEWSPRYLIFPNVGSLADVILALIKADSGDNFVVEYLKDLVRKKPADKA